MKEYGKGIVVRPNDLRDAARAHRTPAAIWPTTWNSTANRSASETILNPSTLRHGPLERRFKRAAPLRFSSTLPTYQIDTCSAGTTATPVPTNWTDTAGRVAAILPASRSVRTWIAGVERSKPVSDRPPAFARQFTVVVPRAPGVGAKSNLAISRYDSFSTRILVSPVAKSAWTRSRNGKSLLIRFNLRCHLPTQWRSSVMTLSVHVRSEAKYSVISTPGMSISSEGSSNSIAM